MNTEALIILIYVLVLASYLGFELIAKVPPTLHTPLMSGSNAISGRVTNSICSTVATIAMSIPTAERKFPLRASLVLFIIFIPMMNKTEATK